MVICKNKKSGQAFIYLDENEKGKILMVTPDGDVKALEPDLFTEPIAFEEGDKLVTLGQITDKQFDIYNKYHHK
jgi:hypothetical protein